MNDVDEKTEPTAVAEDPKVEANEPDTAESGATAQETDGLDELLKEFDTRREAAAEPAPVQPSEPKAAEIDVTALAALEQRLNQQEQRELRRELDGLCSRLIEGVQADMIDAEAFLIAAAKRNPTLEKAYIQRATNPGLWNKVEAELKKDVAKRFGKRVDKQVTASRDAVASAVRSASTAAPPDEITNESVKSMGKDEFDDLQRKLGVTPV